ncbi:uncharacterized protein PAC_14788 [Phialocephala subalpina]|uniref:Uncharacterized protein n=1 Tax=Phialocephala subalpina TaxID=576137 RepID=A0A1L7XIP3_9HELO|nr:uncharacterized protein PAC_14788 [Phialocephala subalpina]
MEKNQSTEWDPSFVAFLLDNLGRCLNSICPDFLRAMFEEEENSALGSKYRAFGCIEHPEGFSCHGCKFKHKKASGLRYHYDLHPSHSEDETATSTLQVAPIEALISNQEPPDDILSLKDESHSSGNEIDRDDLRHNGFEVERQPNRNGSSANDESESSGNEIDRDDLRHNGFEVERQPNRNGSSANDESESVKGVDSLQEKMTHIMLEDLSPWQGQRVTLMPFCFRSWERNIAMFPGTPVKTSSVLSGELNTSLTCPSFLLSNPRRLRVHQHLSIMRSKIQPPSQSSLTNTPSVSKVNRDAHSQGSLAQNLSTLSLSTIKKTGSERKDYLIKSSGSEIIFSDPEGNNKMGLRDFFNTSNGPEFESWRDKIDQMIAFLFSTGVANSDWNCRIDNHSGRDRFMATRGNISYSLRRIITQEEGKAVHTTLVVEYTTLTYAEEGDLSTLVPTPRGKFRIDYSFDHWQDQNGNEVKIFAPSQRMPLPNLQKLSESQAPTKVQLSGNGENSTGIVSFTPSVLLLWKAAYLDAVEVYSGVRKKCVPLYTISPHEAKFELSPRQQSLADFQKRYAHHVLVLPAIFQEDIIKVFQHHSNKILIPFSELWSDDDSDTRSDCSSIALSEDSWTDVEPADPPKLDSRVFAVLVTHPSRAEHQAFIAQLCLQHINVIVCSEEFDTSWLPVKHVVYREK